MIKLKYLAATSFMLTVIACSSVQIDSDYDPAFNFGALDTYNWMPRVEQVASDPRLNSGLLESRVHSAVERELGAKGYRKVTGDADFLVGYHVAIEGKMDVQTMNRYYRYRRGGILVQDTYVREYDEGTLILDIVDAASQQLVWRGWVQGEVRRNMSPEERQAKINQAVAKVLEGFPPT